MNERKYRQRGQQRPEGVPKEAGSFISVFTLLQIARVLQAKDSSQELASYADLEGLVVMYPGQPVSKNALCRLGVGARITPARGLTAKLEMGEFIWLPPRWEDGPPQFEQLRRQMVFSRVASIGELGGLLRRHQFTAAVGRRYQALKGNLAEALIVAASKKPV